MGPEYMMILASKLSLSGAISIFDLPKTAPQEVADSPDIIVRLWQDDLIEATQNLSNVVLLGHSFGGMFCLGTPGIEKNISGLVICDASPDFTYREEYAKEWTRIGTVEMDSLNESFKMRPSEETLRDLFVSWAPFFFLNPNDEANLNLLRTHSYNVHSYKNGQAGFLDYYKHMFNAFKIPTLLVAGEFDRITPLHLFDRDPEFKGIEQVIIPNAGHFPWVENLHSFSKALKNFEKSLNTP